MKKSMLKSFLFAMIGLFTFSQVQAEERVVATVMVPQFYKAK